MRELPPEERVLTPGETAAVLGVNVKTLRRIEERKELATVRTLGGHRRYREQAVLALAEERARAAAERARSQEGMLTAKQVAAEFGVNVQTARKWGRRKVIPSTWSRGYPRLFPAGEVRAMLRAEREGEGS